MSWFESLILGLVQGLTEFLPVSSSAHLRLTAAFSGWEDPGAAFTAITQIGTEAAVLIYFRKDIARILSAWFRSLTNKAMRSDHDAQMGWLVIVGSIPIGVLGRHAQGPDRGAVPRSADHRDDADRDGHRPRRRRPPRGARRDRREAPGGQGAQVPPGPERHGTV